MCLLSCHFYYIYKICRYFVFSKKRVNGYISTFIKGFVDVLLFCLQNTWKMWTLPCWKGGWDFWKLLKWGVVIFFVKMAVLPVEGGKQQFSLAMYWFCSNKEKHKKQLFVMSLFQCLCCILLGRYHQKNCC